MFFLFNLIFYFPEYRTIFVRVIQETERVTLRKLDTTIYCKNALKIQFTGKNAQAKVELTVELARVDLAYVVSVSNVPFLFKNANIKIYFQLNSLVAAQQVTMSVIWSKLPVLRLIPLVLTQFAHVTITSAESDMILR